MLLELYAYCYTFLLILMFSEAFTLALEDALFESLLNLFFYVYYLKKAFESADSRCNFSFDVFAFLNLLSFYVILFDSCET